MTVYLDIVLIENLLMNYIILFTTGYILKRKINHTRLILSSLLGGVYAILTYINNMQIYTNIFMKITLSFAMVYLAYKASNVKLFFKEIIVFYLTSFIFGGTAFAMIYFIKPQNILVKDGAYIGTYPLKIAVIGGIVGFILIVITFKIVKQKITKNDMYCEIEIYLKEKSKRIKAMIDTGNMLKDPITTEPVIVIEKDVLYDLIPYKILDNIEKITGGDINNEIYLDNEIVEYISKFRVIPYTSIGKQNGLLLGIKANKVVTYIDSNEEEIVNDVIIGVYNYKLSKNDKYNALLGLEIFERGEKNEYFKSASK